MKNFINKVLLFIIGLIIINIVLLLLINKLYYNKYEDVNLNFDTYLLADSHGENLLNSEEFGVYNFSMPSDSYRDMYRKLIFLINNTNVKKIILSVDNHTLSIYREKANNTDRSAYYSYPKDYISFYDFFVNKFIKRYVVLSNPKSRDAIMAYFEAILWKNIRPKAKWSELSYEEQKKESLNRIKSQFYAQNSSKVMIKYLKKIISICKDNKIELIGVKFPVTKQFYDVLDNRDYDADEIFKKNDLKIFDYQKVYFKKDNYFKNKDHLNIRGGKIFSKLLLGN